MTFFKKFQNSDLGPLDARCFCEGEICCRHPDYKNVTIEIDPETLEDVSGDEKCITTTTTATTTTTTNKLKIRKPKQMVDPGKPKYTKAK